jgi:phosphohistidine phosphatase
MRTLCILRHAKSSWSIKNIDDLYRPLNSRWYRNILEFSSIAKEKELISKDTLIVTSPSVRTYTTASIFNDTYSWWTSWITIDSKLYTFDTNPINLIQYLKNTYANYESILVVGHNETVYSLVSVLSNWTIVSFPTCAFAKFSLEQDIPRLDALYTPKKWFII